MKSEFQKKFTINNEFYTASQIREAITETFPFENGIYQGLSRITFEGEPIHANQKLNLEKLIPNIEDIKDLQNHLPRNFCYGIIEGKPKEYIPIASTFFIPTNLGYICDEMILQGNTWPINDERCIPK